jgi:hypothetical protein
MPKTRSSKAEPALVGTSAEQDVLDRVIAIALAPLLPGESQSDYVSVAGRFVTTSRPRDTIEEFLVRDVIDLTWEILRLRRTKAGIITASMGDGVSEILGHFGYDFLEINALSKSWAAGDKNAGKEVNAILTKAGMTIDEVTAKTLECKLDVLERLDRMLASAEARRNNALREIDRHREALGAAMRQSVDEVEDADFQDVETGAVTRGHDLDQKTSPAGEPSQREGEHRPEDENRKGKIREEARS